MFSRTHLSNLFNAFLWAFVRYLSKQNFNENIANENGVTVILDNDAVRQPTRPEVWNRVLLGNGVDTIDFGTITGTLYAYQNSGSGWSYQEVTTGLSGAILTLQPTTLYKYFKDDVFVCTCEVGRGTTEVSLDGLTTFTLSDAGVRGIDNAVPFKKSTGDLKGIISCDEGEFPLGYLGTTTNPTTYEGRKDWVLYVNDTPSIQLSDSLSDSLSIDVLDLDLTDRYFLEIRGKDNDTGLYLTTSDLVINEIANTIEPASGKTVNLIYFKLDNGIEATYMGAIDALGNVIGSIYMYLNDLVRDLAFSVDVSNVDNSTFLINKSFSPFIEYGASFINLINYNNIINKTSYDNLIEGNETLSHEYLGYYVRGSWQNTNSIIWLYSNLDENEDVYNIDGTTSNVVNSLSPGFFMDPVFGYYSQVYREGSGAFLIRNFNPPLSAAKYQILYSSSVTITVLLRYNTIANTWNNYFRDMYDNDPVGQNYLVKGGSNNNIYAYSAKEWYDYLITQNRESEMDSFFTFWNLTFQDVWDITIIEYGSESNLINSNNYVRNFMQLNSTIEYTAGVMKIIKGDDMICNEYSYYNTKLMRWAEGKSIQFVDFLSIGTTQLGYLKVYLRDLKINGKDLIPCLTDGSNVDCSLGKSAEYPAGNHVPNGTTLSLPPFCNESEQKVNSITGSNFFARNNANGTVDRVVQSIFDDEPLEPNQTNKANNYTK